MDNKRSKTSSISNSDSNNNNQAIYLLKSFSENPYGRFGPRVEAEAKATTRSSSAPSSSPSRSSNIMQGIFRKLKRKFRKEKKVFGSHLVIVPYNSYTYAKNFDDKDMILNEPDNLSRSFSSRFAATSGMLRRGQSVR